MIYKRLEWRAVRAELIDENCGEEEKQEDEEHQYKRRNQQAISHSFSKMHL